MLTLAGMLDFAQRVVPFDSRSAIRSRLQLMQRLGFPEGINSPGEKRAWIAYDLDKAMQIGVAMALIDTGVPAPRAVEAAPQGIAETRIAYAEAALLCCGPTSHGGEPRWRLLAERRSSGDGDVWRFDALAEREWVALGSIGLAAIVIDMRRLVAAFATTNPDLRPEILRRARIILEHEGSDELERGHLSPMFGGVA